MTQALVNPGISCPHFSTGILSLFIYIFLIYFSIIMQYTTGDFDENLQSTIGMFVYFRPLSVCLVIMLFHDDVI